MKRSIFDTKFLGSPAVHRTREAIYFTLFSFEKKKILSFFETPNSTYLSFFFGWPVVNCRFKPSDPSKIAIKGVNKDM